VTPYDRLNLADHVGDDPAHVAENRAIAAALVGLSAQGVAIMGAVHGASVAHIDSGGVVPEVDALVTTSAGIGLLALAADCVPIALCDPNNGVIAAVHCGWRGLGAGVVLRTIDAMRDLGARDIRAVVGPSICPRCYPVPTVRTEELAGSVSAAVRAASCLTEGSRAFIDVGAGVSAQLGEAHVVHSVVPGCTAESASLFSYRRDGVTGRQGMIVRQ
jgi:YfiH family protein